MFQEVSSSQELIWRRTWNTSAPTRQSPWRTWWCPRTRRCWAGSRNRLPDPKSALSISLLGTLSQRATLCRLSSHWMRNYWNTPRDSSPICIILRKKKMWTTAWKYTWACFVKRKNTSSTWIIHLNINALIGGREKCCLKTDVLVFWPALVCLHSVHYLCNVLYQFSRVSEAAGFMLRWPKQ